MKCSFWKNILGSWLNVRVGLTKSEPASRAEVLRQPIFSNLLILNTTGHPLGVSGRNEGRAIANSGCTRIKDLWDQEGRAWKSLQALRMTYHATNRNNREIIIASIPWNLAIYTNQFQAGDWISERNSRNNNTLEWIYHVTGVTPNTVHVATLALGSRPRQGVTRVRESKGKKPESQKEGSPGAKAKALEGCGPRGSPGVITYSRESKEGRGSVRE